MANKNISGDVNVEFNEAQSRQSLESGESVKTLFGKLRKWLTDLKAVAFSGSYNDLSNKPSIPSTEVTETLDTTPYIYKTSEHDAVYDELVGGSVAWNQLVQNGNFESTSGWISDGGTLSASNNILNISTTASWQGAHDTHMATTNHIYLYSCDVKKTTASDEINLYAGSMFLPGTILSTPTNTVWNTIQCVLKYTGTSASTTRPYLDNVTATVSYELRNCMFIDLTLMFGSTIADYAYNLEQSTAGSGIAWLKSYGFFTEDYYPYNAGALTSANTSGKKVVGKNLVKLQDKTITATAYIFNIRGLKLPAGIYTFSFDSTFTGNVSFAAAGSNGDYTNTEFSNKKLTFNATGIITNIRFYGGAGTYSNMQLELGSTATTYEPYTSITYPIQSTDLRGLYKLNGNKLYTDGDIYSADGTITWKYGIVDLGSLEWYKNATYNVFYTSSTALPKKTGRTNILCQKYTIVDKSYTTLSNKEITGESQTQGINIKDDDYSTSYDFKTAMSGVYLIYELATPTTEAAQPFTSPQMVYRQGTEEFIDTRDVPLPVGGNRKYVDIPDWMINEYFDDVRAEASTISEVKKELNDFEEHLEAFIIKSSFTNPSTITNTSDFTDELFDKYWGSNTDLYPRFAHLYLSGNTRVFLKAIISSVISNNSIKMIKATFLYSTRMYDFTWIYGQVPSMSEYTIQVVSPT